MKSKSVKNIEAKMENLDIHSLRYHVLESAKNFKCSWIQGIFCSAVLQGVNHEGSPKDSDTSD